VVEILLSQPAFEKRSRVNARRCMTLDKQLIASSGRIGSAEEVIETDLVQARRRGVGG